MRLTTYTDYSLRLLIYVAARGESSATIPEVAGSYGISRHHLVKVAHQLGVKGYLTTTRGKNGGLRLAKPAREIIVGEIVRQMEPDMAIVPCLHAEGSDCRIVPACRLRGALEEARKAFLAVLDDVTLADLMHSRKKLQVLLQIQSPGAA
jgi:Rrf2 family transcriptional regulator, nitric oxide-sensitive transcriptional repressor